MTAVATVFIVGKITDEGLINSSDGNVLSALRLE
jgi:hypothetical protein